MITEPCDGDPDCVTFILDTSTLLSYRAITLSANPDPKRQSLKHCSLLLTPRRILVLRDDIKVYRFYNHLRGRITIDHEFGYCRGSVTHNGDYSQIAGLNPVGLPE